MTCPACQRVNLDGGVRCVYCGTKFPPPPEFDIGAAQSAASPASAPASDASHAAALKGTRAPAAGSGLRAAGLLGALLFLLLKGKSLLGLLKIGKLLPTLATMFAFIWAEATYFGWTFAVGFAICILIHELGHVFVNWRKGLKCSAPMFIPFLGAVIFVKQFPDDPAIQSESGAGGPAAGLLAALVCAGIAAATGSGFWLALAALGFAINLFNLIPFPPLDGSHISAVFSPANWNFVLVCLLLWAIKFPSDWLWIILIVGFLFRLGRTSAGRHNLARPIVRARMAAVYLFLCVTLSAGFDYAGGATAIRTATARPAARTAAGPAPAPTPPRSTEADGRQQAGPRTDAAAPDPVLAFVVKAMFLTASGLVAGVAWLLVAFLLAIAAREPMGSRGLAMVGWMLLLAVPLHAAVFASWDYADLLLAYFAALAAGLCFAGYAAAQRGHALWPASRSSLTWRCLGWSAAGALVVAYWLGDPLVAAVVGAVVALVYGCRPWLVAGLAARFASAMGDLPRALRLRQVALGLRSTHLRCVPGAAAEQLWFETARDNLLLDRGAAALAALAAAEASRWAPARPEVSPALTDISRAAALIEIERFEEAPAVIEELLRSPQREFLGPWRPLIAHALLSRLAQRRGWNDEAEAQARLVMIANPRVLGDLGRVLAAMALESRAEARLETGDSQAARSECQRLLEIGREPAAEAFAAVVDARANLAAGNAEAALASATVAEKRLAGSLSAIFWRCRALRAAGRAAEALPGLRELAEGFPDDRWGRRASELLESSVASRPAAAVAAPSTA